MSLTTANGAGGENEDREGADLLRAILGGIDVVTWANGRATVHLTLSIEQFERLCLWESSQEDLENGEALGDGYEPDSQYEVGTD